MAKKKKNRKPPPGECFTSGLVAGELEANLREAWRAHWDKDRKALQRALSSVSDVVDPVLVASEEVGHTVAIDFFREFDEAIDFAHGVSTEGFFYPADDLEMHLTFITALYSAFADQLFENCMGVPRFDLTGPGAEELVRIEHF
jgi:hypothetical protein